MVSGIPASRILRFARTIRWVIARLRHEVRRRDLGGREPADQAQGQRDLGVAVERRVAAQQHQPQLLVGDVHLARVLLDQAAVGRGLGRLDHVVRRRVGAAARGRRTPDPVDGLAAGDRQQPGRRVVGDAVRRPGAHRLEQGVLDGLVREVEVAERPARMASTRPLSSRASRVSASSTLTRPDGTSPAAPRRRPGPASSRPARAPRRGRGR